MNTPIRFGPYLLLERIDVGGMAEVFAARAPAGAPGGPGLVAVKRMLPTLAEDRELVRMFLDEARVGVQLRHPGVVAVHDVGKRNGSYFIVLEYVAGKHLRATLDRLAARRERLPVPLAAAAACRLAEALGHAHGRRGRDGRELRLVHRDVSPQNVLLSFDGRVKLIDFGIAHAAASPHGRGSRALRGKPGYMSPEQARGLPADERSDLFALGAVLYELVTGERPFPGGSELAVLERTRNGEVTRPRQRVPSLPAALEGAVLRALARDAEDRFQTAEELARAVRPFAEAGAPGGELPGLGAIVAELFPEDALRERERP